MRIFGTTCLGVKNGSCSVVRNQLKAHCDATDHFSAGMCAGYIAGVVEWVDKVPRRAADGKAAGQRFVCTPPNVTLGQLKQIVMKALQGNPERLHLGADALVYVALMKAFPCN